jgi:hypothetical protein
MDCKTGRTTTVHVAAPTGYKAWHPVTLQALINVTLPTRVNAYIRGGVHITLKAKAHATHDVGDSAADATITANPFTPENAPNAGN